MTWRVVLTLCCWMAACPLWGASLPDSVRLIAAGLCMVVPPGLGWASVSTGQRARPAVCVAVLVMASTLAAVAIAVAHAAVGAIPTAWSWWGATGAIGAAGVWWARRGASETMTTSPAALTAVACGGIALTAYALTATHVVPPQPDHDFEVQASAYGLLTRAEPRMVGDRGLTWTFAHPPLLHVMVGGTFALAGTLPELAVYDAEAQDLGPTATSDDAATTLDRYLRQPWLVETRAINVVLAALTVGLLAWWATRRSGRWWIGGLTAMAYASSLEVVVRSSYGGYFAATQLGALLSLWLVTHAGTHRGVVGGWGAWLLLIDHKAMLLPIGLLLTRARRPAVVALVVGALGGTALFWVWGLAVAPEAFLADHLYGHLLDRIRHHNPFGYGGYPSVLGLWWELVRHGGPVVPIGLALVAWRPHLRVWLGWAVLLAIAFSVVDWRMTKHLMPLLLLSAMAVVPERGDGHVWRGLAVALSVGQLVWNARWLATLIGGFDAIRMAPGW